MIDRILDGAIVLLGAVLLVIGATGGFDVDAGAIAIRARDWMRPAALLALLAAARGARGAWRAPAAPGAAAAYVGTRGMLALVLAAMGVYAIYHVRAAGGLDSYGYVSAARMIAAGRLSEPRPLADALPFERAIEAATPLGQVPGPDGRSSVPRFPLGLPLVMALFSAFGPSGPYFVPLVMAGLALWLAYLLGRDGTHPAAGLFAAGLVASSPIFALYAVQPMSDVPAACWVLAAMAASRAAIRRARPLAWHAAAGVAAGMALLTRPALLPAAIAVAAISVARDRSRPAAACGAMVAAFVLLQAGINAALYGSAALSGYGDAAHMFEVSLARAAANAASFGRGLAYAHTPAIWILWPAAVFVLRRDRLTWELSAVAAAAAAPHAFYLVFDDWEATRFLLPSIAIVLILVARASSELLRALPRERALRPVLLFAAAAICAVASHRFLEREGIGQLATFEAKYTLVGEWFRNETPPHAVVLSSLHSGAINLYGERPTLRFDLIPEGALPATIDRLAAAGYRPYLALDLPSEPPLFDARFGHEAVRAEPVARVRVVNIYEIVSAN